MIGKQADAQPFALPGIGVLDVEGADAGAFLQAQTMNDVRALPDHGWHWNGCLSAKGRVLWLFALLRLDERRYRAVLPDGDAEALLEHLRRFVFRSKVALAVRADAAAGLFGAAVPASWGEPGAGNRMGGSAECPVLDMGSAAHPRQLRLARGDAPPDVATGEGASRWREQDLRFGLPRLAAAQREQYTPQMLSLDRLGAFSLRKGCYPGQEIVARTHYLGQARRGAVLLQVDGAALPGEPVLSGTTRLGDVASTAAVPAGTLALASMAAPEPGATVAVNGAAAQAVPLLEGLAR